MNKNNLVKGDKLFKINRVTKQVDKLVITDVKYSFQGEFLIETVCALNNKGVNEKIDYRFIKDDNSPGVYYFHVAHAKSYLDQMMKVVRLKGA